MKSSARPLVALIGGQIFLHGSMAGLRLAGPLLVLRTTGSEWWVGLLLALFAAAPIATALQAGRLADRYGYHRPLRIAVALALVGGATAVASTFAGSWQYALLCVAAVLSGAGANGGLIAIQRTAGKLAAHAADAATAADPSNAADGTARGTALKRVFSWLGLAPSLANMLGAMLAGLLIDAAGFGAAFLVLALLPLITLLWARQVPVEPIDPAQRTRRGGARALWQSAVELSATPGLRRLLLVNWLLSTSWDVHSFLVPILGTGRGLSASAIGVILAVFAASVSAVRLLIPVLAHRLREAQVLAGAMLLVAAVFAVYPLMHTAWTMGACAVLLGLALGCVQPMIMSTLHQLTPEHRHGEAIALRSMTINLSSTVMPLGFGVIGATLGASGLFWLMAAMVGAGSWPARGISTHQRG